MSGGTPELPPGLDPGSRPKRSRSTPATSSSTPTPSAAPSPLAPSGAVGAHRRAPGVPERPPADSEVARASERSSGEA
eukprot:6587581-Alexandrium_andersonii.AAC.1